MPPPQPLGAVDVLLVESTYGNRLHPTDDDTPQRLAQIVRDTVARGGSVLLPTFAVGRAQALLLVLQRLKRAGEIPAHLPIFLDSPMAIEATTLYPATAACCAVPAREMAQLCDGVRMVATAAQSQRLAAARMPAIIISASGMATGGRVLHHLAHGARCAPPHRVRRLPGGRQPRRTSGGRRARGEDPRRDGAGARPGQPAGRLLGPRRCRRPAGLAAPLPAAPRQTFVVHGEPDAADTLRSPASSTGSAPNSAGRCGCRSR
jgi:metallo-beta-lactamase family protein